jgi:hypothetical protein
MDKRLGKGLQRRRRKTLATATPRNHLTPVTASMNGHAERSFTSSFKLTTPFQIPQGLPLGVLVHVRAL